MLSQFFCDYGDTYILAQRTIKKDQEVCNNRDELNATIKGSESFKFKVKITCRPLDAGNTRDVEFICTIKIFR